MSNIKSKYNPNNLSSFEGVYKNIQGILNKLPEKFNELKATLKSDDFYQNPAMLFQKYGKTPEDLEKRLKELRILTHPDRNFGFEKETDELYKFIIVTYDLIRS